MHITLFYLPEFGCSIYISYQVLFCCCHLEHLITKTIMNTITQNCFC